MALTLSVPEILADVLPAFKNQTPELFGPGGFGRDFSSKTAVLGDRITARLVHVPVVSDYDENNGGWAAGAQDVTTLLEDLPITLDRMPIATIRFPWLKRMASKLNPDYKQWLTNLAQALGEKIFALIMAEAAASVSSELLMSLPGANLDGWEGVRDQLNAQTLDARTRWAFVNTPLASALGADDRVRSSQFYGQLNGESGFRQWRNLAGFKSIRETPQVAFGGFAGLVGDHRLVGLAARGLDTPSKLADELGIPKAMDFIPVVDEETRVSLTAVLWQQSGTGDVFISVGLLLGLHVGNGGGVTGGLTDEAGCRLRVQ